MTIFSVFIFLQMLFSFTSFLLQVVLSIKLVKLTLSNLSDKDGNLVSTLASLNTWESDILLVEFSCCFPEVLALLLYFVIVFPLGEVFFLFLETFTNLLPEVDLFLLLQLLSFLFPKLAFKELEVIRCSFISDSSHGCRRELCSASSLNSLTAMFWVLALVGANRIIVFLPLKRPLGTLLDLVVSMLPVVLSLTELNVLLLPTLWCWLDIDASEANSTANSVATTSAAAATATEVLAPSLQSSS